MSACVNVVYFPIARILKGETTITTHTDFFVAIVFNANFVAPASNPNNDDTKENKRETRQKVNLLLNHLTRCTPDTTSCVILSAR